MLQFYFMSIFLNAVTGYILFTDDDPADNTEKGLHLSITNEMVRLILGLLAIVTGLLKVLSVVEGDIPVIGDIVPALTGIAAGFILVFEYYREHSTLDRESNEKIERILIKNKKIFGLASLVSAGLHFLFPGVLFL